jgi:hypothetical protein
MWQPDKLPFLLEINASKCNKMYIYVGQHKNVNALQDKALSLIE